MSSPVDLKKINFDFEVEKSSIELEPGLRPSSILNI